MKEPFQNHSHTSNSRSGSKPYINYIRAITLAAAALSAGCSPKPLEISLPTDGRLTKSEFDAVSEKLTASDQHIFKRWSERMNRGEPFGGEPVAKNVRQALLNQQEFESIEAKSLAKEQARLKEIKDQEAAEQRKIEAIYSRRQAVNEEVRKYIDATIPTYRPQTFYDQYGRPAGGLIEFTLKLTNHAQTAAIGIAGFVTIKDVFGRDLGSYPFAIEPRIGSNQTINYSVTLNFDPRNEQHQALWRAKSITSQWFFESVAFENGWRIDANSINRGASSTSPKMPPSKAPNT
jgi:hypothetical protein